jgi:O-succinylbenzoate synthase
VVELGGPRVWNVKVHRVGGLTEALRIHRLAVAAEVALWAGTMPESGIGSQAALAFAALPGCVYPSDLEPSPRWFGPAADVLPLAMSPQGTMAVPGRSVRSRLDAARFRSATRLIVF